MIGAAVEYPVAWLDSFTQPVRDKAAASSKLMQALTEKAIEKAIAEPELVDRAMTTLLGKTARQQTNREEVAQYAIVDLLEKEPDPASLGPTDDWLNAFERLAEDASSDDLRQLFGRILAGEIRQRGSISRRALRMAGEIDQSLADAMARVYAVSFGAGFVPKQAMRLVTRLQTH